SQPGVADREAELIGLHQLCDQDDRQACIRFGFILGASQEFQAEWRQSHPDWWAWEPHAAVNVANIATAPPELPVYEQPPIPAPGYIWAPGYWRFGSEGYFWVPGTWVLPPMVGTLWTPGYWGWREGVYVWNAGYWGLHVGFYGGINYGFGYGGVGYEGGRWNNGVFAYNRTINNFGGVRITNVYSQTVVVHNEVRVSFNGGSGGISARPTPEEEVAAHEQHVPPTAAQTQHQQAASSNQALLASENHGQPAIAATAKPGEFSGSGVVAAKEANLGAVRPNEPLSANRVQETNPAGTNPSGAKTSVANPTGVKTPGANPAGAKAIETSPIGVKTPSANPPGPKTTETNPSGALSREKMGPGAERPMPNGAGNSAKSVNTEAKPLVTAPPAQAAKPASPSPHVAAAPPPHPFAAPHSQARPGPPAKEKKPPG
ncbi:MAG: hypothetical protein WBL55_16795, partial [Xanthobacteraceae bacterium]